MNFHEPTSVRTLRREAGLLPARRRPQIRVRLLLAFLLGVGILSLAPLGFDAGRLLFSQDQPEELADRVVEKTLTPEVAHREIETALTAGDVDLANSFSDLSADRKIAIDPDLTKRLTEANTTAAAALRGAGSFTRGLVTGEPDDMVGLAGTALGDFFVFGDIRDAVREGSRLATGEHADELILGLACVGLAVTAGTYATLGAGTPARVGLSLVKAARKTGRIGARLGGFMTRSVREVVDVPALRRAMANVSLADPAVAVRAARGAVKVEKANDLFRVVGDVGRVQAKAGTQAALDGLKLAEGPRDVSRLARLAETKGTKMRAILKLAGRGAIALTFAAWNLMSWVFAALVAVYGFCAAVKGASERSTMRYIQWKKARRLRRELLVANEAA